MIHFQMLKRYSHLYMQDTDQVLAFSSFSPRIGPRLGAISEIHEIRRLWDRRGRLDDLRGQLFFTTARTPIPASTQALMIPLPVLSQLREPLRHLPLPVGCNYRGVESSQRLKGQCILTDIKAPMPALPEKPEAAE